MPTEIQLRVKPKIAATAELLEREVAFQLKISKNQIQHIEILKRSIDARQKAVKINLSIAVYIEDPFQENLPLLPDYKNVSHQK